MGRVDINFAAVLIVPVGIGHIDYEGIVLHLHGHIQRAFPCVIAQAEGCVEVRLVFGFVAVRGIVNRVSFQLLRPVGEIPVDGDVLYGVGYGHGAVMAPGGSRQGKTEQDQNKNPAKTMEIALHWMRSLYRLCSL